MRCAIFGVKRLKPYKPGKRSGEPVYGPQQNALGVCPRVKCGDGFPTARGAAEAKGATVSEYVGDGAQHL